MDFREMISSGPLATSEIGWKSFSRSYGSA
jgi:hypothetical protein